MKKYLLPTILALILFFLLLGTNPSKNDYVLWLNNNALEESDNFIEKGAITLFGEKAIELTTTEDNYGIFTVYTTDLTDIGLPSVTFLGIFNTFIPLHDLKELSNNDVE